MSTPRQLILSEEPVQRMQWRRPVTTTGVAVVGKSTDNRCELITQSKFLPHYRLRFEVDIADHHDVVECSLPSRGDAYHFTATLVLDWRVTDPVAVVQRRIGDGLELCSARLTEHLRRISRGFAIEECALAEVEINRALSTPPIVLPEGITVHRFAARLGLDDATTEALQKLQDAKRSNTLATVTQGALDIEQERTLRRQQQRLEAVQAAVRGNYDLVAIHLSQHPDDTGSLINMIRSDHQASEERRDQLIGELLKRDLIQDIDVGDLNSALLDNAARTYNYGPPRTMGLPGTGPVPQAALPVGADPFQTASPGNIAPTAAPGVAAPASVPEASDDVREASRSGVVGWRQLPPRSGGSAT